MCFYFQFHAWVLYSYGVKQWIFLFFSMQNEIKPFHTIHPHPFSAYDTLALTLTLSLTLTLTLTLTLIHPLSANDLSVTMITLMNGLVKNRRVQVKEYSSQINYSLSSSKSSSTSLLNDANDYDEEDFKLVKIYNLPFTMRQAELERYVQRAGLLTKKVALDIGKKTGQHVGSATLRCLHVLFSHYESPLICFLTK